MRKTMSMLVKIILTLTLHQIGLDSNILDEENVRLSLQYLCPGVDICNRNSLNNNVNPNEVDKKGFMSCCHGCSCYKDCYINMNCCFPADIDIEAESNSNTSFVNAPMEEGNSSLISDQNSLLWNDDASFDTTSIMHESTKRSSGVSRGNKKINENIMFDKSNISIDIELATKQCMYIKTGTADESWVGRVPAVRMITSQPPAGCKLNTICPTLTQQSEHPTCNTEDIFPWGDFFPVYSTEYKMIFKNELCACCYGVLKYTPWLPVLGCDTTENYTGMPIAEHFSFLQQSNKFSSLCNVAFQGVDTPLMDNRCFMGSIGTCLEMERFPKVLDGVNLTGLEIAKACISGPYAPFTLRQEVYKNVFCAMCNFYVNSYKLQCFASDNFSASKGFAGKAFVYLLDTTSVKKLTQLGKRDEVTSDPIACLKKKGAWIEETCRPIHCPSGQTWRSGVCTFLSQRWISRDGIRVTVNLKYLTSNTSVLEMLQNGDTIKDEVANAFRKTSPWPSDWNIGRILHTSENNNLSSQLAVTLNTKLSLPKKLVANIKTSLRRQWNIVLKGVGITFKQSFFKYELITGVSWYIFEPEWLMYTEELESFINVSVNESLTFEIIYRDISPTSSVLLNKLVICQQITLSKNEYTIMAGGLILLNNLTQKIMFSFEFEGVEVGNGELVPRICLNDSPFILRRENNGASTVFFIHLNLVLAMFILKWILELRCAPIG